MTNKSHSFPPAVILCILVFVSACTHDAVAPTQPPKSGSYIEWVQASPQQRIFANSLVCDGSGYLYAVGKRADSVYGLYRSINVTDTWTFLRSGSVGYVHATPADGRLYIGASGPITSGIYTSPDRGLTWLKLPWPWGLLRSAISLPSGRTILGFGLNVESPGGISFSDDLGATWTASRREELNASTDGIVHLGGDSLLICGWPNGEPLSAFYLSTDRGSSWRRDSSYGTIQYGFNFWRSPSGHLFVGSPTQGLRRYLSSTKSWSTVGFANQWINGLTFGSYGVGAIATSDYREPYPTDRAPVYVTSDEGHTWKAVRDTILGKDVTCVLLSRDGYLFAGTANGLLRSAVPLSEFLTHADASRP